MSASCPILEIKKCQPPSKLEILLCSFHHQTQARSEKELGCQSVYVAQWTRSNKTAPKRLYIYSSVKPQTCRNIWENESRAQKSISSLDSRFSNSTYIVHRLMNMFSALGTSHVSRFCSHVYIETNRSVKPTLKDKFYDSFTIPCIWPITCIRGTTGAETEMSMIVDLWLPSLVVTVVVLYGCQPLNRSSC